VNPNLLHKRDKGKPTLADVEKKAKQFGQIDAREFIPGAEVLVGNPDDDNDSDDDDAESGEEWVNVSHSEGEDEEEEEEEENDDDEKEANEGEDEEKVEKEVMDPMARHELAKELISTTFLTDEDFKKMEKLQMQKELVSVKKGSAKKRKASEAFNEKTAAQVNELVDLASIENIHSKRRHDKEARMEAVRKGQEGREKFGSRKGKMNPFASTSNREKRKGKNFMMLKHKIKRNKKKSFKEQQFSYRKALEKTRKRMLKSK